MTETTPDPADAQRRMWTIGDYPAIAHRLLPISVDTVEALSIDDATTVLDVGTGDGNFAIEAARRGAHVTAVDLTPAQVDHALARVAAEGAPLDVDVRVGDAQALDFADRSFDIVASVLGMMFAPDHARAASEMVRACRAGGTVASAVWTGGGWSQVWQRRAAHIVPPPPDGGPRPDLWGDPDESRRRWEAAGLLDLRIEERPFEWHFASVDEAVELFTSAAGSFITFLERAAALGRADEARDELLAALTEAATPTEGGAAVTLSHPYLLTIGTVPG